MKYLKHFLMPLIILTFPVSFMIGGPAMWWGVFLVTIVMIPGDMLLSQDLSKPEYSHPWLLNLSLYLSLPVLLLVLLAYAWSLGSAEADLLGLGALFYRLTGYDALAARETNALYHTIGAGISAGYAVGGYGINIAHELAHRTWDRLASFWGRLLLALCGSTDFAIEHNYGHHRRVGTPEDPATARRGENVYSFIVRSVAGSMKNAWSLEKRRLQRKGHGVFSIRNQLLWGSFFTAVLAFGFYLAGGWTGILYFALQAVVARTLLEVVNYMEHYGLVREPDQPVQPRHSWNTNRRISSILLFSLTRHSAHHEQGELPFWKLDPYPEAPEMPHGYLTTIYLCLVPPLWYRVIAPRLRDWDERMATEGEKRLLRTSWSEQ